MAVACACLLVGCKPQVDVIALASSHAPAGSGAVSGGAGAAAGSACAYRTQTLAGSGNLDQAIARDVSRAICTCSGLSTSSAITTGGALADGGRTSPGGDVGVNEDLSVGADSEIGGALVVAGQSGVSLAGTLELRIDGDLAVAGPLQGPGSVSVLGNAAVGDRIELGALTITGALTQPSGVSSHVTFANMVGERRSAPVAVQPPCACDAGSMLAASVFAPPTTQKLSVGSGQTAVLDRACAQYSLASRAGNSLTIEVHASAALYVPGDLHLAGDLVIHGAARTELDLFVAGNLKIDGELRAGDRAQQARVRIFVADGGTLPLAGGGELYGALDAKAAELVISAPLSVHGGIAAGRISASAPVTVVYEPL